ncbi:MAG: ATP-binding cassette domain-containing protein, partial [Lachnospiraceae bacterium]|nr:ATP-binding cassette domain-containing protein [Lachnospiraceae bacterium]
MSRTNPIIKLENLDKVYESKQNKVHALNNINLEIMEGEIFGIIGLSGAGKSTLVRCMNLLERPTHGEVIFNEQSLTKLSSSQLSKAR